MAFPLPIPSDLAPSCAATCCNRNLAADEDDDEPPQLVSPGFEGGDTMAAMCIERMEREGAAAGPPVTCWAQVQGLGRGQAASYGAP